MTADATPRSEHRSLIADRFAIDTARPLADVGGGLAAFVVSDREQPTAELMAVQARPWWPPRAQALSDLAGTSIDGLLGPLGHGPGVAGGRAEYFVVCKAPACPSLARAPRPWLEAELVDCLIRPAVRTLEALQTRGVTHRAIRPDNVFRAGPGQPVVLGSAWAAPPASLQPALFEPPYSAMCLAAGRGEGSAADDIYALGVLMVVMALGRLPLAELDAAGVVRAKLDRGSFAAIAGNARLPGIVADLARGMLAEDPEHRPPLALLADLTAARSRRVAARPIARAQQSLRMGEETIWNARGLAYALAMRPEEGLPVLRDGSAVRWLRRGVADPGLVVRLEERIRVANSEAGSDALAAPAILAMQAVAMLDPLAPLCWRGIAIWPDGIGPAIAAAQTDAPDTRDKLEHLVSLEAPRLWGASRADRFGTASRRNEATKHRAMLRLGGHEFGRLRLLYCLNPLLACASPLLAGDCVARLADLLPALEAAAARADHKSALPADHHVAAFVNARAEQPIERDLQGSGTEAMFAQLRLLARLQARYPQPLPALASWLAAYADMLVAEWKNRPRREQVKAELERLASGGQLGAMLELVDDRAALEQDAAAAAEAAEALIDADAEFRLIEDGAEARAELARRLGQEITAGLGLATLVAVLGFAALG